MPVVRLWYASAASRMVLYPRCTWCAYGRTLSIAVFSSKYQFDYAHLQAYDILSTLETSLWTSDHVSGVNLLSP